MELQISLSIAESHGRRLRANSKLWVPGASRSYCAENRRFEMAVHLIELNGRDGVSLPSSLVRQEIQLAFYA